ncbi:MAG TPA: CBS domain-containing protein, partial [Longimicrobium sp.]|nr:CBS domain-containing protein [Longimicrobium sp.]
RDIMQSEVLAVVPEMTVRELIHLLLEERISGAPVLGPTGKVLGVVSSTDVLRMTASGTPPNARVAEIMTPVAFSVDPDESLSDLARFFRRGRVHRALVMEDGVLIGVVTPFDVLHALRE